MNTQKIVAFTLLAVGVSLCAAASARLTEPVNAATVTKHHLSQQAAAAAAAVEEANAAAQAAEATPDTPAAATARATADAANAQAEAAAAALKAAPIIQPKDRLNQWLSAFGALFGLGLALVIGGAVLARRALKAESDQAPTSTTQTPALQVPADLGHMLQDLAACLASLLASHPCADTLDPDAAQAIQAAIESIQADYIDRLTAAPVRARVQVRYGIEGLAALFSPLSAAERRINRAWSALIDRHWPEAYASLTEAHAQARQAADTLQTLQLRP